MSVAFKELGGSPVEQYNLGGFTARRQFLIAWEDRDAFAAEVMGIAATHGATERVIYPGKTSVVAVRLRYEPFDPEHPDSQVLADLTEGLNSYSQSFAKAIVDYRTVNDRDRDDGPDNERGTHLTYHMQYAAELEPIKARGWTWTDDPLIPVAADLELHKRIPVTEHHLTWHQVNHPPWTQLHTLQGKVNSGEFLGCPEATLLFEGAEADKLFRAGFDAGPSEFTWKFHYVFRERAIKQGTSTFGWNHVYREDPAGWVEMTNGTGPLYDLADFTPLFQSSIDG